MATEVSVSIGSIQASKILESLVEVVVDQNYFLPTMFTILLKDKRSAVPAVFTYTDNILQIKLGASVKISFGYTKGTTGLMLTNTVVSGEVTSIEPIFTGSELYLRIRGYDKGHRMTHGKSTRTYGDGSPYGLGVGDADIVKKIAKEYGLDAKVSALSLLGVKYKYVMQYNQNDWDFLWARANRLGYQIYVDDNTLHFCPSGESRAGAIGPSALEYGKNLIRFEPRLAAQGQIVSADAYGWDPSQKKSVSSETKVSLSSLSGTVTPANAVPANLAVKSAFGSSSKNTVIEPNASSAGQTKAYADAAFNRSSSAFMQAYGELYDGDPYLVAGSSVKVSGLAARFCGKYYVTEVRHIWRDGGYHQTFSVTGDVPDTFRSLILGPEKEHQINRVPGVVTAVVTSNSDPEKLGRVQVKYPWLPKQNGSELSSGWARLATVGGGGERGIVFLPEVNDEVLIAFENGDMSSPYVLGVLFNGKDKLPKGDAELVDSGTKKVNQRVIVSRSGHKIILDDSQGKEKISIVDKTGKNQVLIDSVKNEFKIISEGKLDLVSKGDLSLTTEGKLTLKSKGDFSAASDAKMALKGQSELSLNSGQKVAVSANQTISLSANQKIDVKSGTSGLTLQASGVELKGVKIDVSANTMLSLDGSAMVKIQGGIVKIN